MRSVSPGIGRKVFTLLVEMRCNSFCLFCGQREVDEAVVRTRRRLNLTVPKSKSTVPGARYTLQSALAALETARADGYTSLSLQGGEPTVFPDLANVISGASAMGFEFIGMVTNGRRMADRDFATRILSSGLDGITLSLLGPDAATHDRLTAVDGSFDELCLGLRNVGEISQQLQRHVLVSANVIVTALNLESLDAQAELLASLGVRSAVVHLVRFDHMASDPTVRELVRFDAARLPDAIARGLLAAERCGVRLHVEDVPPCLHPDLDERQLSRLLERSTIERHRFEGPSHAYDIVDERCDAPACSDCLFRHHCPRLADEHAGDGSAYRAITLATLADDLDRRLARIDPSAATSVESLDSHRETLHRVAELSQPRQAIDPLVTRIDVAIDDLLMHAIRSRNERAFTAAAAVVLGVETPREVLLTEPNWDAVSREITEWLRAGAAFTGPAHVLRLGNTVDVLMQGTRVTPNSVRAPRMIALRAIGEAKSETLRSPRFRAWCFVAAALIRAIGGDDTILVGSDRIRFERVNRRSSDWIGRHGAVRARWL